MKIIVTGGGSGGHVSAALATIKELLQRHPDTDLLYIGGTMTMEGSTGPSVEETMVQAAGYPFVAISAGKLQRDGFSFTTLKRLWGVVPGFWQAFQQVRKTSPDIIFSTGGYVSVPVVIAGWLQRIPIVIHEQTAAVGLANSIAAKLATKIAITFPSSQSFFPAAKTILTGNPVNQLVLNPDPETKNTPFGQHLYQTQNQDKPLIYITGGGQGSHKINQAIEESLPELVQAYRLVHQTGDNQFYADFDRLQTAAQTLPQEIQSDYYPVKFLTAEQIGHLYHLANLVIARAGANTVLELAYWGKSALFIPIPWVTHQEQDKNAQALVEAGTAQILPESELSGPRLMEAISQQLQTSPSSSAKSRARKLAQPEAASKLVDLLLEVAPSS